MQTDVTIRAVRIRISPMEGLGILSIKKNHKEILKSANSKHQSLKENGFFYFFKKKERTVDFLC